jgi:tetratricopeptide (TPR) repeat protein
MKNLCSPAPAALLRARLAVLFFFLLFLTIPFPFFGQEGNPTIGTRLETQELLDQGTNAFKNGQYEEAAKYFERAKQLDPSSTTARLYLATTYAAQYIPGAPNETNRRLGQQATEEYKGVLEIDPENLRAIDGSGSILFQMAGTPFNRESFLQAKEYFQKHNEVKADDPEPYYWIGVIDWMLAFRANGEMRAQYNQSRMSSQQLRDTDPLPEGLREDYEREYGPMIDEGIASLKEAIVLKPDYDDAMAYLNLLYRRKADVVATREEREQLTKMADELVDKVKAINEQRAASPQ